MRTIIFSGGHYNSALIVANSLIEKGYKVIWLGHKYATSQNKNLSQEYLEITKARIPFINLNAGKLSQDGLLAWYKTLTAFIFCLYFFIKNRPLIVVLFGGYLSVPPALAAWILKIPFIAHEQTTILGQANRFIKPLVDKMFLTWPNSKLPESEKIKVIGLPSKQIDMANMNKQTVFNLINKEHHLTIKPTDKPLLIVSGGKLGSHFINDLIKNNLWWLIKDWQIIHQTGNNLETKDFQQLQTVRHNLDQNLQNKYYLIPYTNYFTQLLFVSDLIIGRTGAHTIHDIIRFKKKMIAIPYPYGNHQEQLHNARLLEKLGLAIIFNQESSLKSLNQTLQQVADIKPKLPSINKILEQYINVDATKRIIYEIGKLIQV